jgi:hypothetical protein
MSGEYSTIESKKEKIPDECVKMVNVIRMKGIVDAG